MITPTTSPDATPCSFTLTLALIRFCDPLLYPMLGKPSIPGLESDPELAKQLRECPLNVRIAFHAVGSLAATHSILSGNFADLCTLDQVGKINSNKI